MFKQKEVIIQKIKKKFFITLLFFGVFHTFSFFLLSYSNISKYEHKQIESWISSFPQSISSNLLNYNYQPISNKLQYIKDTNLFNTFGVLNKDKRLIVYFGDKNFTKFKLYEIKDHFGGVQGFYYYIKSEKILKELLFKVLIISFIILFFLYLVTNFFVLKKIDNELFKVDVFIKSLRNIIKEIKNNGKTSNIISSHAILIQDETSLYSAIQDLVDVSAELKENELRSKIELERVKFKEDVLRQVAHDVRSPLAALNVLKENIQIESDELNTIFCSTISRISGIAEDLLVSNKKFDDQVYISKELSAILAEKRLEFSNDVIIDLYDDLHHDNVKVNFTSSDFGRIISNLINNSVESFNTNKFIKVSLSYSSNDFVKIEIQDYGNGIKNDQLEIIFNKGVSTKKNGNGLGLYHAKTLLNKFGGDISIESECNVGTKVSLYFKKIPMKIEFINEVNLKDTKSVVIVDDDTEIHELWIKKLSKFDNSFKVYTFNNIESFSKFAEQFDFTHAKCFIDFDLGDTSIYGIDLIKRYNLFKNSILVTNLFDTEIVTNDVIKYDLGLIPKPNLWNINFIN